MFLQIDIYSFGVILLEMITRERADRFHRADHIQTLRISAPPALFDLICSCLDHIPAQRPYA